MQLRPLTALMRPLARSRNVISSRISLPQLLLNRRPLAGVAASGPGGTPSRPGTPSGPAGPAPDLAAASDMPVTWIDSLPPAVIPYCKVARLDRPIGTWLCVYPGLWGLSLASFPVLPDPVMVGTFLAGGFIMRGAGCTINDLLDRKIDAQVARTRNRPLASGQMTVPQGVTFLLGQLTVGLGLLTTLNVDTIAMGFVCVPAVMAYPLMKRMTSYPQAWLGLCMNWGVLMGGTAVAGFGGADWSSLAPLYASAWFWTMNYDTIYAHMDKKDDVNVGIGSTALAFGDGKSALYALSACMTTSLAAAGYCAGACWPFYAVSVGGTAAHLGWQVGSVNLSKPQDCLKVFRSNKHLGLIVLCGILASAVVSSAEQKEGAEEEPEEDRVAAL